jgi:hypothetical protein
MSFWKGSEGKIVEVMRKSMGEKSVFIQNRECYPRADHHKLDKIIIHPNSVSRLHSDGVKSFHAT